LHAKPLYCRIIHYSYVREVANSIDYDSDETHLIITVDKRDVIGHVLFTNGH
jgi:hypothetical protein